MAFIGEKIKTEDKEYLDTLRLRNPMTGNPADFSVWTVDRERKMALIGIVGNGREFPMYYAFIVSGKVCLLDVFYEATGVRFTEEGEDIWVRIISIKVPDELKCAKNEILDGIREAFVEKMAGTLQHGKIRVHIQEMAEPHFLEKGSVTMIQFC